MKELHHFYARLPGTSRAYLLPPERYLGEKKRSLGGNDRTVIELKRMELTGCFPPSDTVVEGGGKKTNKQTNNAQNLIKVLSLGCVYRCRADFHADLETQASFTAQFLQNLINRILQGAELCQIT